MRSNVERRRQKRAMEARRDDLLQKAAKARLELAKVRAEIKQFNKK